MSSGRVEIDPSPVPAPPDVVSPVVSSVCGALVAVSAAVVPG